MDLAVEKAAYASLGTERDVRPQYEFSSITASDTRHSAPMASAIGYRRMRYSPRTSRTVCTMIFQFL